MVKPLPAFVAADNCWHTTLLAAVEPVPKLMALLVLVPDAVLFANPQVVVPGVASPVTVKLKVPLTVSERSEPVVFIYCTVPVSTEPVQVVDEKVVKSI